MTALKTKKIKRKRKKKHEKTWGLCRGNWQLQSPKHKTLSKHRSSTLRKLLRPGNPTVSGDGRRRRCRPPRCRPHRSEAPDVADPVIIQSDWMTWGGVEWGPCGDIIRRHPKNPRARRVTRMVMVIMVLSPLRCPEWSWGAGNCCRRANSSMVESLTSNNALEDPDRRLYLSCYILFKTLSTGVIVEIGRLPGNDPLIRERPRLPRRGREIGETSRTALRAQRTTRRTPWHPPSRGLWAATTGGGG